MSPPFEPDDARKNLQFDLLISTLTSLATVDLLLTTKGDWLTTFNLYSANERNESPLLGAHFFCDADAEFGYLFNGNQLIPWALKWAVLAVLMNLL